AQRLPRRHLGPGRAHPPAQRALRRLRLRHRCRHGQHRRGRGDGLRRGRVVLRRAGRGRGRGGRVVDGAGGRVAGVRRVAGGGEGSAFDGIGIDGRGRLRVGGGGRVPGRNVIGGRVIGRVVGTGHPVARDPVSLVVARRGSVRIL